MSGYTIFSRDHPGASRFSTSLSFMDLVLRLAISLSLNISLADVFERSQCCISFLLASIGQGVQQLAFSAETHFRAHQAEALRKQKLNEMRERHFAVVRAALKLQADNAARVAEEAKSAAANDEEAKWASAAASAHGTKWVWVSAQ